MLSIDLKENPLENTEIIWFADGSYLKSLGGYYQAGYAITPEVEVTEAKPLPQAKSAQQAELFTLNRANILAKDKTANVYTDSRSAFEVAYEFGMLWKHVSKSNLENQ